jgi:cephalosporin-C deacetylase
MNKPPRLSLSLSLTLALFTAWTALPAAAPKPPPPFAITTDHTNAIYKRGETVTFTVRLVADSPLAQDAELGWKITKDGVSPIHTGKVQLTNGAASVTAKLNEPGHLICHMTATVDGKPVEALAGAAIDPLRIKPSLPVPADFDSFWRKQKERLAAVPMNPRLTPAATETEANVESFDVQLDCVGPAPVSGYFARPLGAQKKSLPAMLLVQGAGVRSSILSNAIHWASNGLLAMDINAHGIPNGKPAQFYKDLDHGALLDYRAAGRESRDTCYFLGMFLRAIRAIDFLTAQPEWDGKTVIVYGSSQGGFQAFAAAGLDKRVTYMVAGVPAGCDHTGMMAHRVCGWPKLVPIGADGQPDEKVLQAARYFDCVNFATRTKAKGAFVTVGFIDGTCPATSVYAAYNNLRIPKQIYNDIPHGHTNSPAAIRATNQALFDYLKSVKAAPPPR